MSQPIQRILQFVLEKAEEEPVARRAGIYRDLARFVPEESAARTLHSLADQLERLERDRIQLSLDLRLPVTTFQRHE